MNNFNCPRCGSSELREQPTGSIACLGCIALFRVDGGMLVPLLAGMPGRGTRRNFGKSVRRHKKQG